MKLSYLRHKRLVCITTILVFFLILGIMRLSYIQVYKNQQYAREAMSRELNGIALEEYPRGEILDRYSRPLTGSYVANRVVVFPQVTDNYEKSIKFLSGVLNEEPGKLKGLINNKKPAILPYDLTSEQLKSIAETDIKGILTVPYYYRYGPQPMAAHIVGQLGRIKDINELEKLNSLLAKKSYMLSDWIGRYGLEFFYEKYLKGSYYSAYAGLFKDATGKALPGNPILVDTKLGDNTRSDVITTLDADIQEIVEKVMDRKIKRGAVVVMDRYTGEILALTSRPAFNPDPKKNGFSNLNDESYVNQAISLFPPGSIFKVVVAAAALSENIPADTRFHCRGEHEKPIRCWKDEGHEWLTLEEALAESCNPYFVELGLALGPEKLINYARLLGLDNQEIIGYPIARDKRQKFDLIAGQYNLVNSSVGQGPVLATPVQVTSMMNVIANNGLYLPPKLVKEVRPVQGSPLVMEQGQPVQVLSPGIVSELKKMMEMVTRVGVGQKAWVEPQGTAGKTGSAQLAEDIDYVEAWFSGYGPLDNPKYTVTVLVREGISGGETAAPIFRDIMIQLFKEKNDN